jgi:hypothetical protein
MSPDIIFGHPDVTVTSPDVTKGPSLSSNRQLLTHVTVMSPDTIFGHPDVTLTSGDVTSCDVTMLTSLRPVVVRYATATEHVT